MLKYLTLQEKKESQNHNLFDFDKIKILVQNMKMLLNLDFTACSSKTKCHLYSCASGPCGSTITRARARDKVLIRLIELR